MLSFDDWKKVELKVASVVSAERVEGSEKLLKLTVSLGDEERQILAGIGKAYLPEELVGRQIIVVANLEYRKLMGLESQGMLVAASDGEGKPVLIAPDKEVSPGSLLG
jgi:methionine--tRNA ligase beta chain